MSIFVLADTHFSESSEKPMDIFGSRWNGWTEKICSRWRDAVKETDTVILPGDISWGMTLEEAENDLRLLNSLPGQKIIGKGNHDLWWSTVAKVNAFFAKKDISEISLLYNNAYLVEDRIICGCRGWYYEEKISPKNTDFDKIVAREAGRLRLSLKDAEKFGTDRKKYAFFHFPPVFGESICYEILDVLHENNITDCYYGHIHGRYQLPAVTEYEGIRFTLASADYLDFSPLCIRSSEQP